MEPKPSILRAQPRREPSEDPSRVPPETAPPASRSQADPYTAPEAMDPYGSDEPILGPLADGPQFEPNPKLPPTRPLYEGNELTDEQRINLALHPVGRVPPTGEPLAVRPSPPPVPLEPAPSSMRSAIIAGVAVVAVIVAVAGVFFAFMQLRDDDESGTTNQVSLQTATPPGSQTTSADRDGQAALAAGTPSAQSSPTPAATRPSGDLAAAAQESARPTVTPTARATTPTRPELGAAAASDQAAASSRSRSTASDSPLQSGSSSAIAADEMADFLPGETGVPEPLVLNAEGERSADDVIATFSDPPTAAAQLEEWGWAGNAFQDFVAASSDGSAELDWLDISVHQFETADGAAAALRAFADEVINGQGLTEVDVDGEPVGDQMVALSGSIAGVPNAVLYIQAGQFLIKIQTSSATDDPMPATLDFTRELLNGAGSAESASPAATTT